MYAHTHMHDRTCVKLALSIIRAWVQLHSSNNKHIKVLIFVSKYNPPQLSRSKNSLRKSQVSMLGEEKYNVRLEYILYQKIRIQGMIEA